MNDAQSEYAAVGYESGKLVQITRQEEPDTVAEIIELFHALGFSIPPAIKDKSILELETILDAHGDRRGAGNLSAMAEFLRKMTNATVLQVGQRMIVLAYLVGKTEFKTHSEVARKLKVSPGRMSQIIREIPSDFQSLFQLKSRTAKARTIGRETK